MRGILTEKWFDNWILHERGEVLEITDEVPMHLVRVIDDSVPVTPPLDLEPKLPFPTKRPAKKPKSQTAPAIPS